MAPAVGGGTPVVAPRLLRMATRRLRVLRVCDPRARAAVRAVRVPRNRSRRRGRGAHLLLRALRDPRRGERRTRPSLSDGGLTRPLGACPRAELPRTCARRWVRPPP